MKECKECKFREACSEIEQELSCEQVLARLDSPQETREDGKWENT